jgi:hypothetical protein
MAALLLADNQILIQDWGWTTAINTQITEKKIGKC